MQLFRRFSCLKQSTLNGTVEGEHIDHREMRKYALILKFVCRLKRYMKIFATGS